MHYSTSAKKNKIILLYFKLFPVVFLDEQNILEKPKKKTKRFCSFWTPEHFFFVQLYSLSVFQKIPTGKRWVNHVNFLVMIIVEWTPLLKQFGVFKKNNKKRKWKTWTGTLHFDQIQTVCLNNGLYDALDARNGNLLCLGSEGKKKQNLLENYDKGFHRCFLTTTCLNFE